MHIRWRGFELPSVVDVDTSALSGEGGRGPTRVLKMILDVPEGMSDVQVLELVADSARIADGLHRTHGGSGLKVEDGGVQIGQLVPVFAGGGDE